MRPRKFWKVPESSRRLPALVSQVSGHRPPSHVGVGEIDVASWSLSRLSEGRGSLGPWGMSRVAQAWGWLVDLRSFWFFAAFVILWERRLFPELPSHLLLGRLSRVPWALDSDLWDKRMGLLFLA